MKRIVIFSIFTTLALTLTPRFAYAYLTCPEHSSIFGTITNTHPAEFTLRSVPGEFGRLGYIHVDFSGAHINANGLPFRSGTFAGVYGCLTPDHRTFRAEDVTFATDANAYTTLPQHQVTVTGQVDTVENGRFLLDANQGHGDVWVHTNQTGLQKGQNVTVTGAFAPQDASFQASSVTVQ